MSVGHNNLLCGQTVLGQSRQNFPNIVSWVNDHGFTGCLVADDRTVALQWTHREGFEDHEVIVCEPA
jgi:hypothetical protein